MPNTDLYKITFFFKGEGFCQETFLFWNTDRYKSTLEKFYIFFFYIHGPLHRESNLITVRQDATYSVYYISVGCSTYFGCWHPPSGARITVRVEWKSRTIPLPTLWATPGLYGEHYTFTNIYSEPAVTSHLQLINQESIYTSLSCCGLEFQFLSFPTHSRLPSRSTRSTFYIPNSPSPLGYNTRSLSYPSNRRIFELQNSSGHFSPLTPNGH